MFNILIAKADKSLPVDWDAMPENAKRHLIEYGLRQKLNDAGSSATVKALGQEEAGAQAFAMAENVLEALMKGQIRVVVSASATDKALLKFAKALATHLGLHLADSSDVSTLIEAIASHTGKPAEAITTALENKVKADLELKAKIAALKAETPTIDLDF